MQALERLVPVLPLLHSRHRNTQAVLIHALCDELLLGLFGLEPEAPLFQLQTSELIRQRISNGSRLLLLSHTLMFRPVALEACLGTQRQLPTLSAPSACRASTPLKVLNLLHLGV